MVAIKEMTYSKKYKLVQDTIHLMQIFIPAFIRKHLGDQGVDEHQKIWQEGIAHVPDEASIEKKYEIAYGNFIWMAKSNLSYIKKHMGEDGINQFKPAEVEALKRENAGPALFFLYLIRAISPSSAFKMVNKNFSYQFQWITPFSISEFTRDKVVFNIPRCKILDFQDTEDICQVGCQSIYPMWVAEQFKVRMAFERQDNSCTCIVTPLS